MIRHTITREDAAEGLRVVVQKLRAAGIPVRASFDGIRLRQVWEGVSADTLIGCRCIGYGRLEWSEDCHTRNVEFRYYPPADSNVIDVEAREIIDTPLLTNDQRP